LYLVVEGPDPMGRFEFTCVLSPIDILIDCNAHKSSSEENQGRGEEG
jgi:hypothetical protein